MRRRQQHDLPADTRRPAPQPAATPAGTPAAIRAEARTQLRDYPEVTATDALLVADILTTDAIRCGRAVHQLRIHRRFSRLRVEVLSAPAPAAPPDAPPESADEGISRLLLEELTLCWDVELDEPLQAVRADLALAH